MALAGVLLLKTLILLTLADIFWVRFGLQDLYCLGRNIFTIKTNGVDLYSLLVAIDVLIGFNSIK